jgi:tetratricopeptide (TPR) repeat protein
MALEVRKEQVVLAGTVAILGLMVWQSGPSDDGGGGRRSRRRSTSSQAEGEASFLHFPAPDTALAHTEARGEPSERDLFAPPRDTRPLPPLALVAPPLPVATALRPPPEPALAPDSFGRFLRADPTPTYVPGLFASEEEGEGQDLVAAADPGLPGPTTLDLLKELAPDQDELTPEQRAAQIESWKKLYDWIHINEGDPLFGQIRNEQRFDLARNTGESIWFVEVRPEQNGVERFPGQDPVEFKRERVLDFGLADTTSNYIQLRRREFTREITPSVYADLIAFGRECVARRLEAREALRVAEEMFAKASAFDPDDPIPRIWLARCYEAGFQFEKAYETYLSLLERFEHRAEVHVGLGLLEARMRLFDGAEARFREAERTGRGSYIVQWALGRFLSDRGRWAEALAHLRDAQRFEPKEPSATDIRARIRTDLGAALMAMGEVEEALSYFDRALQADETNQRALAGRLGALGLGAGSGSGPETPEDAGADAGFELLIVKALADLESGNPEAARDGLLLAAETDPLRAHVAWRALSWLAEVSGYPEEAFRWIEEAHRADPTDAWTLYQRGRLLAVRDDPDGARESLKAALDQELFFVDVLVEAGRSAYESGQHDNAELFFERSLFLDGERAEVHALRGINLLALNDVRRADEAFDAALDVDGAQPLALVGKAWVSYRGGDSERAITQFAELDDRRRSLPEEDPYRVFAKAQMERIADHEEQEIWSDRFERRRLMKGWDTEEAAGPEVSLEGGQLVVRGTFKKNDRTRVFRELSAPDFVSIEMDVTVMADNNAKVGVFIAKERRRGGGVVDRQGEVSAAREKSGVLALLMEDTAKADPEWEDVPDIAGTPWWPTGRPVRVRIEKVGEGSDAYGRISVDGILVRDGFGVRKLATSSSKLKVGLFVEGQTGLPAHVVVDDVEMVYRVRN